MHGQTNIKFVSILFFSLQILHRLCNTKCNFCIYRSHYWIKSTLSRLCRSILILFSYLHLRLRSGLIPKTFLLHTFYMPHIFVFLFDRIPLIICKANELRTCSSLFFILLSLSVLFSRKQEHAELSHRRVNTGPKIIYKETARTADTKDVEEMISVQTTSGR